MSQDRPLPPDFAEWIVHSLDGTITPEQFAQLEHEITTNATARAYYLEFVATHVGLLTLMGAGELTVGSSQLPVSGRQGLGTENYELRTVNPSAEQDRVREIERIANRQLAEFLAQQQAQVPPQTPVVDWDLWTAICGAAHATQRFVSIGTRVAKVAAVCLLVLGLFAALGLYIYAHRTLGQLVASTDTKWDVPVAETGELRAGRRTLEEGYARIRLKKGAEVIVQAPSTFDLRSTNRLFLEDGWVTASVPPTAAGFTILTPTSSVVDFGTEFGLLAGGAGNTEVHVFAGRIEFEHAGGSAAGRTRAKLSQDEALTVDAAGHTSRMPVQERPRLFSRTMPTIAGFGRPGKRLGLADIVGAGNGLDTGVWGQGLDASTGLITSGRKITKKGNNGFQRVAALPFIDGVFVPDSNNGPPVVTSTGLRFEQCPKTSGTNYEAILNGATFQVGSSGEIHPGHLAGQTYDAPDHASIGIHPNAGITFDLEAIRSALPEAQIRRFQARCGVSDNVVRFAQRDADPNAIEVTFWVLVDGQLRFSRTLKVVPAQSEQIDIPLEAGHRFLTLATTTPGEYRYCWALFAEPALELTRAKDTAAGSGAR